MASAKVKLPPQLQAVEDLVLWRNPPLSAAALAGFTLLYLVLEVFSTPLLTWLANLSLVAVITAALWAVGAKMLHMTGPEVHLPALLTTGIDEGVVRATAERLRQLINKLLSLVAQLLSGTDLLLSAKAVGVLLVVAAVGRVATPVGLLYASIVLLFSLPKLYEMRKDDVDKAALLAREHAGKHYEAAVSKVNEVVARLTPQKAPRPAAAAPKAE